MADDDEGLYDELYGDDDDDVPMAPPQIIPPEEPAPEEPTPAPEEPAPVAANAPGDGDGGDDDDSDDDFDIALNEPEERGSDEEPDEFMIQLDDTEQKQQLYQQQYGAEEEDAGAGDELEAQLDGMPGAAPDDAAAQSDPIHYRSKTYVRGSAPPPPAPPPGAPSNPAAARAGGPPPPAPPPGRPSFAAGGSAPAGVPRGTALASDLTGRSGPPPPAPPPGAPSVPRYVGPAVRPPPPLQMEDGTWNTYNRQPPNARYNEKGQRMMPGGEGGSRFIPPEEYKEFLQLGHGGIFDVDLDNIDVAPWRKPGADVSSFFNFGLNEHTWRQYASDVRHARLELALQEKIQTVGDDDDIAYPHGPPPEMLMQRAMDARQVAGHSGRQQVIR